MAEQAPLQDVGDRIMIMVVVATGFAVIFAWWSGFVEAEIGGVSEYLIRGGLIALFLVLMVVIWRRFEAMDES